jgi:hypothetical protein
MNKSGVISDLLVRTGLVDSTGLERALEVQLKNGGSLGKVLADLGLVDEIAVSGAIARELKLECLGADLPEVLPECASLLPADFCRNRLVVPLSVNGNSLRLAMVDPLDYATIRDVLFRTSKEVGCGSPLDRILARRRGVT